MYTLSPFPLLIYPYKPFVSLATFSSRWTLLILSLHIWRAYSYFFWITWVYFHLVYTSCLLFWVYWGAARSSTLWSFDFRWTILGTGASEPWISHLSWAPPSEGSLPWNLSEDFPEHGKVFSPEVEGCGPAFCLLPPCWFLNSTILCSLHPEVPLTFTYIIHSSLFICRMSIRLLPICSIVSPLTWGINAL